MSEVSVVLMMSEVTVVPLATKCLSSLRCLWCPAVPLQPKVLLVTIGD